ncbi:MAG: hypothetical protein E5V72_01620 [Mesorhizobium sp.]|uniref:hypothetical protein n=1 Tax=Mesorhizobium sp. TaxID=1871066 RepID=UPI000FE5A25C|nr:hypothetical protein [Mesorhizobium sp.]RWB32210.1 MAG: hypothetical protein EOQ43_09175 [Mesorhizobium sp.]RWB79880.1 MAG: hypothetical protein EOQ42_05655 [Mesorhizobium sp.]RWF75750.1 MAG: hypothetical protein EOS26_14470 [Mesorhizobium sp.]TIS68523.1 MAG: hypothetical protein E5W92_04800 [Mesorhizobium sp.]TIW50759.1 MAG: hypothetical protein E5V72_01620 [Mesorhizobium sp.]
MIGDHKIHNVRIIGPAQVPYHFRLVGMKRELTGADLLSNKDGVAETQLQAGTFLCYAQDLTTGELTATKINIVGDGVAPFIVELGEEPRQRPTTSNFRPSRIQAYEAFRAASAVPDDIDEDLAPVVSSNSVEIAAKQFSSATTLLTSRLEKRFSIGLSIDLTSARKGGWRALQRVDGLHPRKDSNQIVVDFGSLAFRPRERLRLSVGVEGDQVWQVNVPLFETGLHAEIALVKSNFGPELTLRLIAPDPSLSLLLAGSSGFYPGGFERISGFQSHREGKLGADPWTDLSWALADIRAGVVPRLPGEGPWPWKKYDPISDGYVVWAWVMAASAERTSISLDQRCLNTLVLARKLGRPYFSATSELATEMLQALASSSKDSTIRANAKYEAAIWRRRGRTKLKTGPFYAWERPEGNLQTGKLPAETYRTLVSGHLRNDELNLENVLI